MVEVFRTNVTDPHNAKMLVERIHQNFEGYKANFDLWDCDNILRVKSTNGNMAAALIISIVNDGGFIAEILPDESPSVQYHINERIRQNG